MTGAIPIWTGKYVGIQFKDRGRDILGCDCWGLVRIILYNEFNLTFPSLLDGYKHYEDAEAIKKMYQEQQLKEEWVKVESGEEKLGDVIVFRIRNYPCHVGLIVTNGMMLHIERGANSTFVPYLNPRWKNRIDGIYRPKDLVDNG